MHPLWIVLLGLLLGQCILSPQIEAIARGVALAAALVLVARERRRRGWVLGALILGGLMGLRLQGRLDEARSWDGWEGDAVCVLQEDARDGLAMAWVRAEGLPPQRVRLSRCGEAVAGSIGWMHIRVWLPPGRRNPDDIDRLRSSLARGPLLRARVMDGAQWVEVRRTAAVPLRDRMRRALGRSLRGGLGASAALWSALLVGDRSDLSRACRRRFQRLGLAHLLALSGLHVGLVAALLLRLVAGRLAPTWILAPLAAWAWLAGLSPSLVRAVVMAAWYLLGRRLHRPLRGVDALAAAGVLELLLRPSSVVSLGWWLSYVATLSLLRVASHLPRRRVVAAAVVVTVAPAATLPWVLSAFGRLPLAAPLWNLMVAPLFSGLMALGLVLVTLALIVSPLARAGLFIVAVSSHVFGWILRWIERFDPGAMGHPGLGGGAWAIALVAWALVLLPDLPGRGRHRTALAVLLVLAAHAPLLRPPQARWWSLDVGQGDAGVLRVQGGGVLVVDTGVGPHGRNEERVVVPYLGRRNLSGVRLLVTHGHRDHYGGAVAVLHSGRVGELELAACDRGRRWTLPLVEEAERQGVRVRWLQQGDTLSMGPWQLRCLWPPADAGGASTNDRSLVVRGGPPEREILLTGDQERPAEKRMLEGGMEVAAAVLKVAHHGSRTGTGEELLERMSGGVALISCGAGNRYGHPHASTLEALRRHGWSLLRTDRCGAVGVVWTGEGVRVRTVRGKAREGAAPP